MTNDVNDLNSIIKAKNSMKTSDFQLSMVNKRETKHQREAQEKKNKTLQTSVGRNDLE